MSTTSWKGDITNDNIVNINDAQYISNWIASSGTINNEVTYSVNNQKYLITSRQINKIDINKDKQININDAQYLLNWLAAGGSMTNLSVVYSVNGLRYTVQPETTISLTLQPGLNLLYIHKDGSISGEGINHIYQFDSSNNTYNQNNTYSYSSFDWISSEINANNGYFVDISSNTLLSPSYDYSFIGELPVEFNINVRTGWNIIGWNSQSSDDRGTITDNTNVILPNTLHEYNVNGKHMFGLEANISDIKPNIGYWVKCNGSNQISINKNTQ